MASTIPPTSSRVLKIREDESSFQTPRNPKYQSRGEYFDGVFAIAFRRLLRLLDAYFHRLAACEKVRSQIVGISPVS